jgi:hypothetical protein
MTSRPDPEELAAREADPAGEPARVSRESDRIPTAAEGGAARREPRGLVVAPHPPIAGTPIVTIVAPTVEVSDSDATTRMPALNADLIQLPEDSWTPFAPTAIDRHYDALAAKPGPKRYNSETTVYTPIPSETDGAGDSDRIVIDVPAAVSERFSPLPAPPSASASAVGVDSCGWHSDRRRSDRFRAGRRRILAGDRRRRRSRQHHVVAGAPGRARGGRTGRTRFRFA